LLNVERKKKVTIDIYLKIKYILQDNLYIGRFYENSVLKFKAGTLFIQWWRCRVAAQN